jgi:hypothetical protein
LLLTELFDGRALRLMAKARLALAAVDTLR